MATVTVARLTYRTSPRAHQSMDKDNVYTQWSYLLFRNKYKVVFCGQMDETGDCFELKKPDSQVPHIFLVWHLSLCDLLDKGEVIGVDSMEGREWVK